MYIVEFGYSSCNDCIWELCCTESDDIFNITNKWNNQISEFRRINERINELKKSINSTEVILETLDPSDKKYEKKLLKHTNLLDQKTNRLKKLKKNVEIDREIFMIEIELTLSDILTDNVYDDENSWIFEIYRTIKHGYYHDFSVYTLPKCITI